MHYKPSIEFMRAHRTLPDNWESWEDFANRVNHRISELSDRHVIDDVQFSTERENSPAVMIRYHLDPWAPTMRDDQ